MNNGNDADPVTLINVFSVESADQQQLVDLLIKATDGIVDRALGFLGSRLHRSLDGTKVTMVALWRSADDYAARRADRRPLPFLEEALKLASFAPRMYEVVRDFAPRWASPQTAGSPLDSKRSRIKRAFLQSNQKTAAIDMQNLPGNVGLSHQIDIGRRNLCGIADVVDGKSRGFRRVEGLPVGVRHA